MRADLAMPKDFEDTPREPARRKAERRWRNYDVEKRFKEEKVKPPPDSDPVAKTLEIAEVISREKPDGRGSVIRAETKFAKYIRGLLEGHTKHNQERIKFMYAVSIRAQRKRLLFEKLRRLELREAERVAQQNQGGRCDLFS
jgi:hypothetical protein